MRTMLLLVLMMFATSTIGAQDAWRIREQVYPYPGVEIRTNVVCAEVKDVFELAARIESGKAESIQQFLTAPDNSCGPMPALFVLSHPEAQPFTSEFPGDRMDTMTEMQVWGGMTMGINAWTIVHLRRWDRTHGPAI